jgi:hypothetical protein
MKYRIRLREESPRGLGYLFYYRNADSDEEAQELAEQIAEKRNDEPGDYWYSVDEVSAKLAVDYPGPLTAHIGNRDSKGVTL